MKDKTEFLYEELTNRREKGEDCTEIIQNIINAQSSIDIQPGTHKIGSTLNIKNGQTF